EMFLAHSVLPRPLFALLSSLGPHRDLHSFPTRRSSDLGHHPPDVAEEVAHLAGRGALAVDLQHRAALRSRLVYQTAFAQGRSVRSEEHTSELQSRSDLVCRLLLEKKQAKTRSGSVPGDE